MSKEQLIKYFTGLESKILPKKIILTPFFSLKNFKPYLGQKVKSFSGKTEIKGIIGNYKGSSIAVIKTGIGTNLIGDLVISLASIVEKIIFGGAAGALNSKLAIGDYFITTAVLNGEGFSQYYLNNIDQILSKATKISLDDKLNERIQKLPIAKGTTYTIGSLTAENEMLLALLKNYLVDTIDMETSALYAAAKIAGIDALAVHFISDFPQSKPFYQKQAREDQLRLNYAIEGFPKALLDLLVTI